MTKEEYDRWEPLVERYARKYAKRFIVAKATLSTRHEHAVEHGDYAHWKDEYRQEAWMAVLCCLPKLDPSKGNAHAYVSISIDRRIKRRWINHLSGRKEGGHVLHQLSDDGEIDRLAGTDEVPQDGMIAQNSPEMLKVCEAYITALRVSQEHSRNRRAPGTRLKHLAKSLENRG